MTNPTALVGKLLNYCSVLRDDGLSYGDYVKHLTIGSVAPLLRAAPCASPSLSRSSPDGSALLLAPCRSGFAQRHALPVSAALRLLKMADEQSKPPHNKTSSIPKGYDWPSLLVLGDRRLSVIEELEATITINIQRATRLRQAILQKAFAREL